MSLIKRFAGTMFDGNCADFVQHALRTLGRELPLPQFAGFPDDSTRAEAAQLIAREAAKLEQVDEPAEGDVVVMWSNGALSHVGIAAIDRSGAVRVLHVTDRAMGGVSASPLTRLPLLGYRVEGFYRV